MSAGTVSFVQDVLDGGSGVFGGEGVAVGAGDFVEEGAEGLDFFGLGGGEVLGFGGVVFEVVEFGGEGGVLA